MTILERGLPICGLRPNRLTNKLILTISTPHIGHSRHGLFFARLDCQSNAKPSEKDHDLLGIRTRDLFIFLLYAFITSRSLGK
jgi:hypothetical protein